MRTRPQNMRYIRDKRGSGRFRGLRDFAVPTLAGSVVAAALILPAFMFHTEQRPQAAGLGPDAWPIAIFAVLAAFAVLWLVLELRLIFLGKAPLTLASAEDEEGYSYGKALVGLALILAYGWLWPVVGFTLATASFLLIWCLYGGIRNALTLLLVPAMGTFALLWMFMGLALMPLSRGMAPFDQFSVWFLRLIGIY